MNSPDYEITALRRLQVMLTRLNQHATGDQHELTERRARAIRAIEELLAQHAEQTPSARTEQSYSADAQELDMFLTQVEHSSVGTPHARELRNSSASDDVWAVLVRVATADEEERQPIPESFGALLRHYRARAGVSLSELARRINYSKSHVSKIENGHKRPNPMFARLCDRTLDTGGVLLAAMTSQEPTNVPGP